ncbi:MAK10-like protein [Tanacetum coccineum]
MGDKNPIRTLGDYSKPSHEGYMNTIELPEGNNVVHLRSDTIRLVQNGCLFHGLRSEDPNQHLKDFLKLVDSFDLNGDNRERTRLRLFQFSLRDQSRNWLERLPAGSITIWEDLTTSFLAQFFPPGRTEKLHNDILILLDLEDQINFLLKGPRPTSRPSSTHVLQAYVEAVSSTLHPQNQSEPPNRNPFTFRERTGPYPQPQALETTFEARVRDYMAAHVKRMERYENAIFKQREVINDIMAEMFGLLKELSTRRTPKKKRRKKNVVNKRAIIESIMKPSNSEEEEWYRIFTKGQKRSQTRKN